MTGYFSGKNTRLTIRKFMRNYLQVPFKDKKVITHEIMKKMILRRNMTIGEERYIVPKKVSYQEVKLEDVMMGRYLEVIDDVGQIQIYKNPLYLGIDYLMTQIKESSKEELEQIRLKALGEINDLTEEKDSEETDLDEFVYEETIDEYDYKGKNKFLKKSTRKVIRRKRKW